MLVVAVATMYSSDVVSTVESQKIVLEDVNPGQE